MLPTSARLADLAHDELVLPHPVQDIPAYFAAAESATEARVCFLNSYSQPLDPAWLRKLSTGLDQPRMGAVGATGSAESLFTYYRDKWHGTRAGLLGRARHLAALLYWRRRFAAFPNLHLRTNAFLIGRQRFLQLRRPVPDKNSAERFESGRRSLTACLRAQGLEVGVVGRDGVCYPPARWSQSRTFRSGAQENLLVADNRTLQYGRADAAGRAALTQGAWGLPTA